MVIVIFFSRAI